MRHIPEHIEDFIVKEIGVEDLELFVMEKYNDSADNHAVIGSKEPLCKDWADYINGFTLALTYVNRHKLPKTDHRWLRIRMSIFLAEILHKLKA